MSRVRLVRPLRLLLVLHPLLLARSKKYKNNLFAPGINFESMTATSIGLHASPLWFSLFWQVCCLTQASHVSDIS